MSPQSLVELTLFSSSAATRSTSLLRCVSTAQRERRTRQSRRTLREGGEDISANISQILFRIPFQILLSKKLERTLSINHYRLALFHSHCKKTDHPKDKLNCQDGAVFVNQTFIFYIRTRPGQSLSINKIQCSFSIHSVHIQYSVFIEHHLVCTQ